MGLLPAQPEFELVTHHPHYIPSIIHHISLMLKFGISRGTFNIVNVLPKFCVLPLGFSIQNTSMFSAPSECEGSGVA